MTLPLKELGQCESFRVSLSTSTPHATRNVQRIPERQNVKHLIDWDCTVISQSSGGEFARTYT
jgi:hypothetical protein